MPESSIKVIVNPVAGGGAAGRDWPAIEDLFRKAGLSFDCEFTERAGQAAEIAKRSAAVGYRCLVAVGGDGTVNEVASGILRSNMADQTVLGTVSTGTARAFALSLGISREYASTCSLLTAGGRKVIDVGVVQCQNHGETIQRYFVNEASLGFSAEIVDSWRSLPRHLGRAMSLTLRLVAGYGSLVSHRNNTLRIRAGKEVESVRASCVVVANGRYLADGMQMAPHANLSDGLLDLVIVGDLTKAEILRLKPRLYDGTLIAHPKIIERKTAAVTVESDKPVLIEADGEIIGESPASFWVRPSMLTVAARQPEDEDLATQREYYKEVKQYA